MALAKEFVELKNNTILVSDAPKYIRTLLWDKNGNTREGINAFMWGNPGIGKTSIVHQIVAWFRETDPEFKEYYMTTSHMDTTDLEGIPYVETIDLTKITKFALPDFLPRDPNARGIIFLDEFNNAAGAVMNVCQQLIQERRIGEYHLPKGIVVIAAGNPSGQNAYSNELSMPMKNRFCHMFVSTNADLWTTYFMKQGHSEEVQSLILGFINQDVSHLEDEESMNANNFNFATPRQWCKFADVLEDIIHEDRNTVAAYASCFFGNAMGNMFASYKEDAKRYQDPMEIIEGKKFTCGEDTLSFYYTLYAVITKLHQWHESGEDPKKISKGVTNLNKAVKGLSNDALLAPATTEVVNKLFDYITLDDIEENAEIIDSTRNAKIRK